MPDTAPRRPFVLPRSDKFLLLAGLFAYVATLGIPFAYDQINLALFKQAENDRTLLIREYLGRSLQGQPEPSSPVPSVPPSISDAAAIRLISMDYVRQMRAARSLSVPQFLLFASATTGCFLLGSILVVALLPPRAWRGLVLAATFVVTLAAIQVFGLPHTNHKFHVIFGLLFAALLALADTFRHLAHPNAPAAPISAGQLSALQYEHRFWMSIVSLVIAALLTVVGTLGFITFDIFQRVFGESFMIPPLVGLLFAAMLAILGTLAGIIWPLRRHLALLESAMRGPNYINI